MKIFRLFLIGILVLMYNSVIPEDLAVYGGPPQNQDISVFVNAPATAKIGSSFIVEVKVVLGNADIKSARITQTLPQGFTASVIDAQGAVFSFQNQIVKFLFVGGLYPNTEYLLKYKVSVAPSAAGTFSITGELRYASNGAFIQELPAKSIKVVK